MRRECSSWKGVDRKGSLDFGWHYHLAFVEATLLKSFKRRRRWDEIDEWFVVVSVLFVQYFNCASF